MQFFYENHTCLDKSKYLLCRTDYSTLVFPNISSSIPVADSEGAEGTLVPPPKIGKKEKEKVF